MQRSVLLIWFAYIAIFTLLPMGSSLVFGPHPVFYSLDSNLYIQLISAFFLIFGAAIPVFVKMRPFRLRRLFGLINLYFRVFVIVFILSHILVYIGFGLDFRHSIRISSMGFLGYFYALEQVMIVPFTFFVLRLAVCGAYEKLSEYKVFLTIYGLVLVTLPFNVFNLLCGSLFIIVLYFPKLLTKKLGITSAILLPSLGIVALVGATFIIKGADNFDGLEAVARYLQYRISIWYTSTELIANMPLDSRFYLFSESFADEASINTVNANVIFNTLFANPRVGAGPGIFASSLYLLPFPLNLFLVMFYGFMVSYTLKCSGLFKENRSLFLLIAVFCLLFPFFSSPIQYASLELMPLINLVLSVTFLIVAIPKKSISNSDVLAFNTSKGDTTLEK